MKNKKTEKDYIDELKEEYERLGDVRCNRIIVGCLVTVVIVLFLLALKFGILVIK